MDDEDSGFEFSSGERYPDRSNPKFDSHDRSKRDRTHQSGASTRRNQTEPPSHRNETDPSARRNETEPSFRRNDTVRVPVGQRRSNWRRYAGLLWKLFLVVALLAAPYFAFVTPGIVAFEPIHWYNVIVDTISGWIIEWLKIVFKQWPA